VVKRTGDGSNIEVRGWSTLFAAAWRCITVWSSAVPAAAKAKGTGLGNPQIAAAQAGSGHQEGRRRAICGQPDAFCLLPDDEGGGKLAVGHLAALGRRRIASITGP